VDLVTEGSLSPYLRESVLASAVVVYERDAEEVRRTAELDVPELKASIKLILEHLGPHIA